MTVRLTYIGRLLIGDSTSPRLWNIVSPEHPRFRGTFGIHGLVEAGIIKGNPDTKGYSL